MTAPNGQQTVHSYAGRTHSVTAKKRGTDTTDKVIEWTQVDALGNLELVRNYNPSGSSWVMDSEVKLTHDATGNLTQVLHAAGDGTTTMTYDGLGRKLTMNDPDLGAWSYAYDRHGNLVRQTDARGKAICLYYNSSNLLTGKRYTTGTPNCSSLTSSMNVTYAYGATGRAKGKVTAVNTGSWSKAVTYDAKGLPATEAVTIAGRGVADTMTYSYDGYKRLTALTYPDGDVVTSDGFTANGLPTRLHSTSMNGNLVDQVQYDVVGRLTAMRMPYGTALFRQQVYEPFNLQSTDGGLLTSIKVGTGSLGSNNRLNLTYSYDSFSNIKTLSEAYTGGSTKTHNFAYDAQNRVTNAFDQTFGWSASGNLTSKPVPDSSGSSQAYSYEWSQDSANPHGVKWVGVGQGATTNGTVTVRAKGSVSSGVWPTMELWVNGVKRKTWTVNSTSYANYSISTPLTAASQIDVRFNNDGGTRDLYVASLTVNGVGYTPSVAAVMDRGKNAAAFDGMDLRAGGNLYWNGALRFVVGDGVSMGYDQNGNMSYKVDGSGASIYQYDHENRLESVTRNAALQESYLYDDSGQRVKKVSGNTAWYYPFPQYEVQVTTTTAATALASGAPYTLTVPISDTQAAVARVYLPQVSRGAEPPVHEGIIGGVPINAEEGDVNPAQVAAADGTTTTVRKHYLFGGQRIALWTNQANLTPFRYLHADHLGSTVMETCSGGAKCHMRGYHAFGGVRGVPGGDAYLATDHAFTGQKVDGTGLYYYNARYYDPVIGQFVSPDTIVPEPGRVFAYNRYMYVLGNPLRYNDPTGHLPDDIGPKFDPGTCQRGVACPAADSRSNAPAHDPSRIVSPFSPDQMAQLTTIAEQVAATQIVFDDSGQIDWNQTLESGLGDVLSGCGKLVDGVCGISPGVSGSVVAVGASFTFDLVVDQNGEMAGYMSLGGGGYATFSGYAAHGRGNALIVATNATVDDMGGWSVHFGGSLYSGTGAMVEWISGRNGQGEIWHGAVISGPMSVVNAGWGAEIHASATHSWPLYRSESR